MKQTSSGTPNGNTAIIPTENEKLLYYGLIIRGGRGEGGGRTGEEAKQQPRYENVLRRNNRSKIVLKGRKTGRRTKKKKKKCS